MRRTLVTALLACAGRDARTRLRHFLAGLSADELEFLAGFQGARILEGSGGPAGALDYRPAGGRRADLAHKMIVLREYLARCQASLSLL